MKMVQTVRIGAFAGLKGALLGALVFSLLYTAITLFVSGTELLFWIPLILCYSLLLGGIIGTLVGAILAPFFAKRGAESVKRLIGCFIGAIVVTAFLWILFLAGSMPQRLDEFLILIAGFISGCVAGYNGVNQFIQNVG
jgi:hypothetical protein